MTDVERRPYHTLLASTLSNRANNTHIQQQELLDKTFTIMVEVSDEENDHIKTAAPVVLTTYETLLSFDEDIGRIFGLPNTPRSYAVVLSDPQKFYHNQYFLLDECQAPLEAFLKFMKARGSIDKIVVIHAGPEPSLEE